DSRVEALDQDFESVGAAGRLKHGHFVDHRLMPAMATTRQLRICFLFALVMLIGQFLLGMAVNLFVKIPDQHPGATPPEYFSGVAQSVTWAILNGNLLLAVHAGFGLVLVVAAVGTL